MKLYASPNSPFSTRIWLAAKLKDVRLQAAALPVGGLRSAEFLALNPLAKIPVLETEDGLKIPESEAILRYLEDRHPDPSLMPRAPEERARVNVAVRLVDAYVMDPVIRLFSHLDPATRDAATVKDETRRWSRGAEVLAAWLEPGLPKSEVGLTLADCALAPALHLSTRIAAMIGLPQDPTRTQAVLRDYTARMAGHPVAGPFLAHLTQAQHAYDLKAGRPSVAHWHDTAA